MREKENEEKGENMERAGGRRGAEEIKMVFEKSTKKRKEGSGQRVKRQTRCVREREIKRKKEKQRDRETKR